MQELTEEYLRRYASNAISQRLIIPPIADKSLDIFLRRDDLLSTHYPGNKFYKLFFNIQYALENHYDAIVTFGGPWSNHIHAVAAAAKEYALQTVGIIRGHRPKVLTATLEDAQANGMRLLFLDRKHYQEKNITPLLPILERDYPHFFLIPEGGNNDKGIEGCQILGQALSATLASSNAISKTICCAVGTGATLTGVISGVTDDIHCLGFSVLKGDDTLTKTITEQLTALSCDRSNWRIEHGYHHGGYAKTTPELLYFMRQIEQENQLSLDQVYSAKMLWGISQLALQDYWEPGSRIEIIHGGGLQGRRGFTL